MDWEWLWKIVRAVAAKGSFEEGIAAVVRAGSAHADTKAPEYWKAVAAEDWTRDRATVGTWVAAVLKELSDDVAADAVYFELGDFPELFEGCIVRIAAERHDAARLEQLLLPPCLEDCFPLAFEGRDDKGAPSAKDDPAHWRSGAHHGIGELKSRTWTMRESEGLQLFWPAFVALAVRDVLRKDGKKILGKRSSLMVFAGFEWTCASWLGSQRADGWKAPSKKLLPKSTKPAAPKEVAKPAKANVRDGKLKGESDEAYVKRVVESGVNPNFVPKTSHFPPLYLALGLEKWRPMAEALVQAGANVNAKVPFGDTLLGHCIDEGKRAQAEYLIEKGARTDGKDTDGRTLLHAAARHCPEDKMQGIVEKLLAAGLDPNARDKEGATPLHHASGDPKIVRTLLAAGAQIDARDKEGATPLLASASNEAVAKALLEAGADAKAADKSGTTALHLVAGESVSDKPRIVAMFVKAGADPNARNKEGNAPLHELMYWAIDAVAPLVKAGADPNAINKAGDTPLHAAARNLLAGKRERHESLATAVKALVEAGARSDVPNKRGETVDAMAKSSKPLRDALKPPAAAKKSR